VKKLVLLASFAALVACSQEPAAEPTPAATTAVAPAATPSLPAPDQALFTRLYAEACPAAEPVSTAVCRRAGMGSDEVLCEYGLGEDEYRRNQATLVAADGAWTLRDAEATCAAAK
jgi:hypothetical protein